MENELFAPTKVGSVGLRNHVVMSPMTRCRAVGNIPNAMMAEYYGRRAGAGLIITEGTAPSPNGLGYARIPGMFSKEQAEGWKNTTEGKSMLPIPISRNNCRGSAWPISIL